ncbi:CTAG/Pcc1 family [Phascolomyces articulosus]|uniref:CTAG/Pcc1 family n=1 Tax=Phascolomyces articulosus TaxID=60185 RepID=A0AAD5JPV8_9FUNG|nr:CTAG/Pcc1 family [Phascolomyces articulosus]
MTRKINHKFRKIEIPFPSNRLATIARRVINVDKELKTDQVQRTLTVNDNKLEALFECTTARMMRVSVNSFLEMLTMVTRTMEECDTL